MNNLQKYLSTCVLAMAALVVGASPAFAASSAPSLGAASNFAVLSTLTTSPGAVTCTDSTIDGDVGTASSNPLSVTQTRCTISGAIITPVSAGVIADFNSAYDAYANIACTDWLLPAYTDTTLTLVPGVYCNDAGVTFTDTTLILQGNANAVWIFKIGTGGTGALTGTNFSVIMANGGDPCNVFWWVAQAVTMTTSGFQGTILAGAAITMTGLAGPTTAFNGNALAKAAVTLTNFTVTGCESGTPIPPTPKQRCNQGVGNGPEGCDPGKSNQGEPSRSNDEVVGATSGDPGRKGGNGK